MELGELRLPVQLHDDVLQTVLQLLVLLLELDLLGSHHHQLLRELVDPQRVRRRVGQVEALHEGEEVGEEQRRVVRAHHVLREVNRGNRVCE